MDLPALATLSRESEEQATVGTVPLAALKGRLVVSSTNIFEVDGHILVAPSESQVADGGRSIVLPSGTTLRVGDDVFLSGGYLEVGAGDGDLSHWERYVPPGGYGFFIMNP